MFNRFKTMLSRWHDIREVEALSSQDLGDLGLSRDQVRTFTQMPPEVGQRVTAMAQVFGVDEPALTRDRGQWADMLSGCNRCADAKACGAALSHGDITHPSQAGFCPNRDTFTKLALPT